MKYTLLVTRNCTLACSYCYVGKRNEVMDLETASAIIDYVFQTTPPSERIDLGFFGGEPLMEFELIQSIVSLVEDHPNYNNHQVLFDIVTNGTLFSPAIAEFLKAHQFSVCISCDGPPWLHDRNRKQLDGTSSSAIVENTIKTALEALPFLLVNAVFDPKSLEHLPATVDYLLSLGINQIYLNPDYSASWSNTSPNLIQKAYNRIADIYIEQYLRGNPSFISLIDSKIALILRGGYASKERCQMGKREFAFTPDGSIYPCERLVGVTDDAHCIGNIKTGLNTDRIQCSPFSQARIHTECLTCGVKEYCMNNCGCSNYFSTGSYNTPGPFLCATEKISLEVSFRVFQTLNEKLGPVFIEHLSGMPNANSRLSLEAK